MYEVAVETVTGRELSRTVVCADALAGVIRKFASHPRANCLFVNGRGYFSMREALAPLVEVNRFSLSCNGDKVFRNV